MVKQSKTIAIVWVLASAVAALMADNTAKVELKKYYVLDGSEFLYHPEHFYLLTKDNLTEDKNGTLDVRYLLLDINLTRDEYKSYTTVVTVITDKKANYHYYGCSYENNHKIECSGECDAGTFSLDLDTEKLRIGEYGMRIGYSEVVPVEIDQNSSANEKL